MSTFEQSSPLPVSAQEAYAWHAREGAFLRLTPPWEPVTIEKKEGTIENGRVVLRMKFGPISKRWIANHHDGVPGHRFIDSLKEGPFKVWDHEHRFETRGSNASQLIDHIEYRLPLEPLSRIVASTFVKHKLERMFRYRHEVTTGDLEAHRMISSTPKSFAITGASGLVGQQLSAYLSTGGHTIRRLVRRPTDRPDEISWNPEDGSVDVQSLEGSNVVVHLAGENVAGGRWTAERKNTILQSRIRGTRTIAEAISRMQKKPDVLLCASAIGYYGNCGDETLDENARKGTGFLADVVEAWEAAAKPALDAGVRVVFLRIGIVLSAHGGALAKMLTPFRLGAGGPIGSGKQFFSWVSLDDVLGAILFCAANQDINGVVNVTSPHAVRQKEFAKTLGRVLHRPAFVPLPAFVVETLFGEMGREALLSGQNVSPSKLIKHGYSFRYAELEALLRHETGCS